MAVLDGDISGVRNKIVRGQLLAKQKKEKNQAKLRKRIARKEAENRGEEVERGEFSPSFYHDMPAWSTPWSGRATLLTPSLLLLLARMDPYD